MSKIKLPAKIGSLVELIQFVTKNAERLQFSQKRIQEIQLAVEEALVNIFHYAFPEGGGEVEVTCRQDDMNKFIIEIEDTGIAFDVLSVSDPDIHADISERKEGGLGIYLIKKMVDDVRYRREGDRNILTFTLNRE